MAGSDEHLPDWQWLLVAERHLQHLVPGATLVGGTAAAIHAGHRASMDGEMARIKAWLLVTRHTVRDYLDSVVLFERLGEDGVVRALRGFDALYRQENDASPLSELADRLAAAVPKDLAELDLKRYRGLWCSPAQTICVLLAASMGGKPCRSISSAGRTFRRRSFAPATRTT